LSRTLITDEAFAFLGELALREEREQAAAPAAVASFAPSGSSYKGAEINRFNRHWQPGNISGDAALYDSWPLLNARIRDLIRNEPTLLNAKRTMVSLLVGCGIQTFAAAHFDDGEPVDDYNAESDEWHERWACSTECDAEAKRCLAEIIAEGQGEEIETGDLLLLEVLDTSPGRTSPLCYQLLEAEQLDCSLDRPAAPGVNKIVRGIEFDGRNRAVAYHIFDAHPYDPYSGWTTKSSRVPASRVIHAFIPPRPSASRGMCWFAVCVQPTRDMDMLIGSELTAANIAALFTLMIKRKNFAGGGLGFSDGDPINLDDLGNALTKLGRGIISYIGPEDEIMPVERSQPGPQLAPFIKILRQQESMGTGLSYLRMTKDYESTSYTSARGAHLDDEAMLKPLQMRTGFQVVQPIRMRHNAFAVALGRIRSVSAAQFKANPWRWQRFDLMPPGREQLDPDGETDSIAGRIRTGVSTLKDECGARGKHWRKVLQQRALETKEIKRLGLEDQINFSKGGGAPGQEKPAAERNARRDGTPAPAKKTSEE
jgi:lambda family phage portal protein